MRFCIVFYRINVSEIVTRVDRETGAKFYDQLEDEREFKSTDIENQITLPDRNRKIIEEQDLI